MGHDQDALEAGDEGRQAGDLWEDSDGAGEASQDHRQGLRGGGLEEVGLSWAVKFCFLLGSGCGAGHLWETHRRGLRCCRVLMRVWSALSEVAQRCGKCRGSID